MLTVWLTRVAAGFGGLALSMTAGAGLAAADPELGPIVNTTCTYRQVMGAMKAESPQAAAEFNSSPEADSWLRSFLAASPSERKQMAREVEGLPALQPYKPVIKQIADTCKNY
jgi:hemophore-related protein